MSFLRWLGSFFGSRPVEVPGQPLSAETEEDWGEFEPVQIWVGLGNPGAQYAMHRHNVGFMAVDAIAGIHDFEPPKKAFSGWTQQGRIGGERILLLKPATFMNDSGRAVGEAMRFFKKQVGDVTVFHDELDLAPFKVKVKTGGGTAGHNGLRSTEAHIGNPFRRVRIGEHSEVHVNVPIVFTNEERSRGLKRGGVLNAVRHELELICDAAEIPEQVEIDLAGLDIGDSLHISTVKLPQGTRSAITDRDFTIATIVPSSGMTAATDEGEATPADVPLVGEDQGDDA